MDVEDRHKDSFVTWPTLSPIKQELLVSNVSRDKEDENFNFFFKKKDNNKHGLALNYTKILATGSSALGPHYPLGGLTADTSSLA